ncbi:MAG: hypothetical protein QOE64_715 [Frankiales bacterium]|nr:hypothetical protein [Frankiales bacterium]
MRPIAWGYPDPETFAAWERDDVEVGGCCIPAWVPHRICRGCGATWDHEGRVDEVRY